MKNNTFLLVGTYTNNGSKGIYVLRQDPATRRFNIVHTATGIDNPSFLTVSPDKQFLYAVSESGKESAAYAYKINPISGELTLLNHQPTGNSPCHITTDRENAFVLTGNYGGGSLTVLPVQPDGSLGTARQQIVHQGSGPVTSRQQSPHVHSVNFSPDGSKIFVPDLGTDKIMIYDFDPKRPMRPLDTAVQSYLSVEPGGGPRHFTFSPNGKYAYAVLEISGKVAAFSYTNHKLAPIQIISGAPADYKGNKQSSADIHCSPDGKFLYTSNRGELNNISIFKISEKDGSLTLAGHQSTMGQEPRNFLITPDGQFLFAANQKSNNIVIFKRDTGTGLLTPTGEEISVPVPVCLQLLEL